MKKNLLKIVGALLLAMMILPIFAKPMDAKAASYPIVSYTSINRNATYEIGENAKLTFTVLSGGYKYERYTMNIYKGSSVFGTKVASASDYTQYITSNPKVDVTVNWDTTGYDAGVYTVDLYYEIYTLNAWREVPYDHDTWSVYLVPGGSWILDSNGWWYQRADGSYPVAQWEAIRGSWYYFNGSGYMVTGWQNLGGTWYYLDGSGAMVTGWQNLSGTWYYFDGSGAMATGWKNLGGTWYYLNGSGAMVTGWKNLGGTWYYFNGSGAMIVGWQNLGGTWYYFNGSGAMVTGWQLVGGEYYYFASSGAMLSQTWVGDYYLQADGSMATNKWIGQYYVGADGKWIPGYVEDEYAQNLSVLKNYITVNGELNSNGNKFIKIQSSYWNVTYTAAIVYDVSADELNFIYTESSTDVDIVVAMSGQKIANSDMDAQFLISICDDTGNPIAGAIAEATVNVPTFDGETDIQFTVAVMEGDIDVQYEANNTLRSAFEDWTEVLSLANLTVWDLGFEAYGSWLDR